ncbi:MAG TPA: transglycosylase domain-containing protein [Baekduia sp.]|uniref:transglycosylase domain-containing protein n=1 Tax=Baekduia sp. TaxID=2600305 RepID=UPI002D77FAB9|nr:transglycosylase domain-containing protein [Baekduia sp.]HET6510017.1 transglycosylase domain-containing protein [Baekduia sp.]
MNRRHENRTRRRRRRQHRGRWAVLGVAVAGVVLAAVAATAAMLADADPQDVLGCKLAKTPVRISGGDTLLTAADGSPLGYLPRGQHRDPVDMSAMSRWLPKATVAIEDRRFWSHGALDPYGIARSLVADVVSGRTEQGASTVTQQLVRNRYLGGETMNASRKLTEACLSLELFRRWSRRDILQAYLNTVYYGHHARGVQAAAWTYFSKPARALTLDQAALLAGLPQAPSRDDPLSHPAVARARRGAVLKALRDAHAISTARMVSAQAAPLGLAPDPSHFARRIDPAFFAAAQTQLAHATDGRSAGSTVRTTLNERMQRLAQKSVDHWIAAPSDPAAAMVVMDPSSGRVLAAATSPGAQHLSFDLATQSRRQAGSAFKMFTLVTALQQGIPLSSVWSGPPSLTIDERRCRNGTGPWVVHNYADETSGTMNLVNGIAHSVNTIFAQVAVKVGPDNIVRTAQKMGVTSPLRPVCSITLGPEGVSPLEMTDAFSTLASGGIHHAPTFLASPASRGHRVLTKSIAARATYALSAVIHGGTGTAADPGRPAAGKTGTSEDESDAWFCGFVPQLAACVWVGYPTAETPMTSLDGFAPVVGGSVPARIWHDFMVPALAGRPVIQMPQTKAQGMPQPKTLTTPGSQSPPQGQTQTQPQTQTPTQTQPTPQFPVSTGPSSGSTIAVDARPGGRG